MGERLRGIESDILPQEGGQTLIGGARNHQEKHYCCVPEDESPYSLGAGGGALNEGQRYIVYPRDSFLAPIGHDPQGVYVHVHHTKGYATVAELHEHVKALGYPSPGECIITVPPMDGERAIGYLVKVAEAPKPGLETEWGYGKDQQDAINEFLLYLGQRGPGATSI